MDKLPEISRIMFVGLDELFHTDDIEESTTTDAIVEASEEVLNDEEECK